MKSKLVNVTHKTRRVSLVLILALLLTVTLSATVWAAWGAARRGLVSQFRLDATATPTRTPRPALSTPTPTAIVPVIVPFTPTPTPTPLAVVTPEPLPDALAQVVARYGIDPTRRFVVIDLATQTMTLWDPTHSPAMDGETLRTLPVSTGDETRGYRTLAWYGLIGRYVGTFNAYGVYADDAWYLFEDAGQILVHSAPYRLVEGQKVYEELDALGSYPASKGCIRLLPEDARWFTQWQPEGVPLVILPK